jgi:ribosomal protein L36
MRYRASIKKKDVNKNKGEQLVRRKRRLVLINKKDPRRKTTQK